MAEQVENRQEYHDVVARVQGNIVSNIGDDKTVKRLAIFSIRQAYIIWRMDDAPSRGELDEKVTQMRKENPKADYADALVNELDEMKLDEKDANYLLAKMFTYQSLAGIKPVQTFRKTARVFERHREYLKGNFQVG